MKVICIDNKGAEELTEGNDYIVEQFLLSVFDLPMYYLIGFNRLNAAGSRYGYDVNRFVPLSEIDEMEFIATCNKELVE